MTSSDAWIADFGVDGFYGPFPSKVAAKEWASKYGRKVSQQSSCLLRKLKAPRTGDRP